MELAESDKLIIVFGSAPSMYLYIETQDLNIILVLCNM